MKVEIWSDVVCPLCYIGKRKFEQALSEFDGEVDIIYKSYELHPHAPKDAQELVVEALAKKFNITVTEAKQMNGQAVALAAEVGLEYKMDNLRNSNTMDAHRLTHLAMEKGKMKETVEKLFEAHFTKEKSIHSHSILKEIGLAVGLEAEELDDLLGSDRFRDTVEADQAEASLLGIKGVPFFLFNSKYAVSGAQPKEVFLEILHKVKQEEANKFEITHEGDVCSIDGC
ncbi:DsbA family oxidoreductase [Paenibacillus xylanexedens]|uniref:DsbA family oxidoreductase n=1 Tax=Paenibacillus xylanexedens TaxID=528191 RepID=UPI0011A17342